MAKPTGRASNTASRRRLSFSASIRNRSRSASARLSSEMSRLIPAQQKISSIVPHGHTARQDCMPLAIHSPETKFDVPGSFRAYTLLPRLDGVLCIVGMKHITPAEVRTLLLSKTHHPEKRLAGIDVPTVRGADPHAIVDGFTDSAVKPFTLVTPLRPACAR